MACSIPAEKMLDVPSVHSRQIKDASLAFNIAIYTRAFYEAGCPAGILRSGYSPSEIKNLFPEVIANYDSDRSVVVWSFGCIPKTMRAHGEHLHLMGQDGKADTLYYFLAPVEFVASVTMIIPGEEGASQPRD